ILAVPPELISTYGYGVGDAEIMEGTKKLFLQSLRQPDLRREAVAEICGHIVTVHPLGGRSQTQEYPRCEIIEDGAIAGGGSMMGLIDHDVVVETTPNLLPQSPVCQHPDR